MRLAAANRRRRQAAAVLRDAVALARGPAAIRGAIDLQLRAALGGVEAGARLANFFDQSGEHHVRKNRIERNSQTNNRIGNASLKTLSKDSAPHYRFFGDCLQWMIWPIANAVQAPKKPDR